MLFKVYHEKYMQEKIVINTNEIETNRFNVTRSTQDTLVVTPQTLFMLAERKYN